MPHLSFKSAPLNHISASSPSRTLPRVSRSKGWWLIRRPSDPGRGEWGFTKDVRWMRTRVLLCCFFFLWKGVCVLLSLLALSAELDGKMPFPLCSLWLFALGWGKKEEEEGERKEKHRG